MTLLTAEDYLRFPILAADCRYAYGDGPQQFGELFLPASPPPRPVVALVHGGGYQEKYDLQPVSAIARALANEGFAVWNIEYRRAGNGGEYPNMFLDVGAAADFLHQIADEHGLDLSAVISIGHSAGGHLALWLAGRHRIAEASPLFSKSALPIAGVAALAPLADVAFAFDTDSGGDALSVVMGREQPSFDAHLRDGSPRELLPLGVPQIHIVGDQDEIILTNVRHYLEAAEAAGDEPELILLEGAGHFEIVAVDAPEWKVARAAILNLRSAIQSKNP